MLGAAQLVGGFGVIVDRGTGRGAPLPVPIVNANLCLNHDAQIAALFAHPTGGAGPRSFEFQI